MVDFSVDGDLRFLSHQDMLRLLGRTCTRACIPVRYTEGFNPRPRLSLPLPRPVGIASDAERVVFELAQWLSPGALSDLFAEHLPPGIGIHQVRVLDLHNGCVPRRVYYSVAIDGYDRTELASRAADLMRFEPRVYRRFVHKKSRDTLVDLRPYLSSIAVGDDEVLFGLYVTGGGTAKPSEICALMGIGGERMNHLVRRRKIQWRGIP